MAFFNEAYYSDHSPSSSSPPRIQSSRTPILEIDIERSLDDAVDFLSSSDVDKLMSSSPTTSTPKIQRLFETPPSSVHNHQPSSSDAKRKRVDFAPFTATEIGWAANAGPDAQKENTSASLLRKLQPSKERSSLRSKSILKASRTRGNEQSSSPEMQPAPKTWDDVLEFGLKQLRSEKPGMRLDAWRSMQQFLATTSDVQVPEELAEKHNVVLSNALRDVTYTQQEQDHGMPNQLPNFTLKFLSKFLQLPGELSSASLASLLDISIQQLQTAELSKNLVRCYLEFLYQQNFKADILTPVRIRKIVEAMHGLNLHETSSGILLDEMKVCRKFVDQCPEGMIASTASWLSIFLRGIFSDDTVVFRFTADTLFDISIKIGHRIEVSKALQRLLREVHDKETGRTTMQCLEQDMAMKTDFVKDTNAPLLVPRLLSALLMLSRGKGPSVVFGEHFRSFVSVIKSYFMKTTSSIASQAYTAWSWLIIAQTHGGRWPEEQAAFLRRPIENVLMNTTADLNLEKATPAYALSVYLVLLYSSFTPDARQTFMRQKWDLYVAEPLQKLVLSKSKSNTSLASQILCALLASETPWDAELLVQTRKPWHSTMSEVGDLARVDAHWIRSNLDSVLPLLDRFLKSPHRADHAINVFKALLDAVAHASTHEIVATKEAKGAVAEITNYLTHLWGPYSRKAKDMVLFGQLLELLIDESSTTQGKHAIFTEKILRKSTSSNRLEVATTPSHRSNSSQQPNSAIAHFLVLLTQELVQQYPREGMSQERDEPSVLFDTIKRLTTRLCLCESTLAGKLTVLCSIIRKLIQMKQDSGDSNGRAYVDQLCLEGLSSVTEWMKEDSTASESLESIYPQLVGMMSEIACHCTGVSSELAACYRAVVSRAQTAVGPATALISITEASARNLHHFLLGESPDRTVLPVETLVNFADAILDTAPAAVSSGDIRRTLEKVGGVRFSATTKKSDLLEMYHMTDLVLMRAYEQLPDHAELVEPLGRLFATMAILLKKQSTTQASTTLKVMQSGISAFVLDKRRFVFTGPSTKSCVTSVLDLWDAILSRLGFEEKGQDQIDAFEKLVAAGLSSRSPMIINKTVEAWSRTYGLKDGLQYPPKVAKALRKLCAADIEVTVSSPLPQQDEQTPDSPLLIDSISEGLETEDEIVVPTPKQLKIIPRLTVSPAPQAPASASRRRTVSATPKSKPKPRHEDSQIHFEPITSSPMPRQDPEVLTKRQLEVAERQREGSAALFAEVSTPVPEPARPLIVESVEEAEEQMPTPSTPVLAAGLDDAIPSSSPVVASVKRRESSARRTAIPMISLSPARRDEVPSSPPAAPIDHAVVRSRLPVVDSLTLDRNEILRRKRACRQSQSIQHSPQATLLVKPEPATREEGQNEAPEDDHTVPSTAPPATESFNSIMSIPLTTTDSSDTRVQDSFVTPHDDTSAPAEDIVPSCEPFHDDQELSQQSLLDDSQVSESQRKKRRRGRTSFVSSKKRRTSTVHVYNEDKVVTFTPKRRFITPDDMLPVIFVKVPGEPTPEPADAVVGAEVEEEVTAPSGADAEQRDVEAGATMEEEIQVPATTKRGRGRPRKSFEGDSSQASKITVIPRKRSRSSSRSHDADTDKGSDAKRSKVNPRTPSSRERSVSSVHYIEVTPGDIAGRRGTGSGRTDSPEAEAIISLSQQALAGAESEVGSTIVASTYEDVAEPADTIVEPEAAQIPDLHERPSSPLQHAALISQIEETQIEPVSEIEDEDFSSVHAASPAPSVAPSHTSSQASQGSQASQSSQMSSFSVSAFKGVMSRFVDQIREFVNGGSQQATEEAARQMAEEANRTVERLARAAKRNEAL